MPKLPDNEIREITDYLEKGKPLPDKYRFSLFRSSRQLELLWNGKNEDVQMNPLPFQIIEQVDEPRSTSSNLYDYTTDSRGRHLQGWKNKLIWGDNRLILASLLNGPLRKEIDKQGGLKLVYIDPPFDVGDNFSYDVKIQNNEVTKLPSRIEKTAFYDTWGEAENSFLSMIYERLKLIHSLMSEDGSLYLHCDWRLNSSLRLVLDEIFGKDNFQREIIWDINVLSGYKTLAKNWIRGHDTILFYTKNRKNFTFNKLKQPHTPEYLADFKKQDEHGKYMVAHGTKRYLQDVIEKGKPFGDVWDDVPSFQQIPTSSERVNYPTQKPTSLMKRIILASSNENDLIADFFCGSGTTLCVAETLNRKWIGTDLGKFAIHTSRKRLINTQRENKKNGKTYRAFEILNLGRYERSHFLNINKNLNNEEQILQRKEKTLDFINQILKAYKADKLESFRCFDGKKNDSVIAIGPINLPVGRLFVEECIKEALANNLTQIDILAFEYEMGLFPNIQEYANQKGIILKLLYIPRDVFETRLVKEGKIEFTDVAYLDAKIDYEDDEFSVKLIDFSVSYDQDSLEHIESNLKKGSSNIAISHGNIFKITKEQSGKIFRESLLKHWSDWIDYWSVDFDFESKKEIVLEPVENQPARTQLEDFDLLNIKYKERWTGDYIFENEWQTFRTPKNPKIVLSTPFRKITSESKIAIKVVDVFGNDTMIIKKLKKSE